jgi:hypothetical protein
MKKPVQRSKKAWDYHEVFNYIKEKYNIDVEDYAGYFKSYIPHLKEWCEKHGEDYNLLEMKNPTEKQLAERRKINNAYQEAKDGDSARPPYLDFWGWITDRNEIHNGCYFYLTVRKTDWEDMHSYPEWVKEIVALLDKEFNPKTGDMLFYVDW